MAKEILTKNQLKVLRAVGQEPFLAKSFYLSGGTALAAFYLKHRYSEDLDFFSEEEFASQNIYIFFKNRQKELGIKKIDYQQSFNRHLFFLFLKNNNVIKTEFTYYPFHVLQKSKLYQGVKIDSLLDIAVNKLFTIYQQPRSRDFIDLYLIIRKEYWPINELIKKAKIKFDWHVDPLQLAGQFNLAAKLKDYPRMIKKVDKRVFQMFFLKEARKLKQEILKD